VTKVAAYLWAQALQSSWTARIMTSRAAEPASGSWRLRADLFRVLSASQFVGAMLWFCS
jgi:hypothetical protein